MRNTNATTFNHLLCATSVFSGYRNPRTQTITDNIEVAQKILPITRQFIEIPVKITGFAMLEYRVFRSMVVASALAVTISAFIAPWRVTAGLLVGGLLALFSHRWLKNSAAAAIQLSTAGGRPQLKLVQFVLRYAVIAAVVFSLYTLDLISLPAVLVGMSSFVVAMMVEAVREFYFAITKREEN